MSIFDSIKLGKGKRNSFNLSHNVKLSCDMGQLVPVFCEEVIPDDTFKVDSEVMVRFAPMIAPIMHDVNVTIHYFFVPNRLVWDHWREFITGGEDGRSDVSYPRILIDQSKDIAPGSLYDYLGFPAHVFEGVELGTHRVAVDALPFRAFNLIWNEYYRDQNLEAPIDILKDVDGFHGVREYESESGSGSQSFNLVEARDRFFSMKYRAWEKDYFTSALPWTQRGDTVRLPLAGEADITSDGSLVSGTISGNASLRLQPSDGVGRVPTDVALRTESDPAGNGQVGMAVDGDNDLLDVSITSKTITPLKASVNTANIADALKADMSSVTSTTINELRRSYALQRWLERNSFGGSRYIEQILSHFGVRSSDARLQRPEYLGGGRCPVRISQVLQTSQSTSDSALGTMAGHGLAVGKSNRFKCYFEEHGWVIGIMSILPRSAYSQGMPRKFSKFDRLDYAWPEFGHLGEQAIKNKEIFFDYHSSPLQTEMLPDDTTLVNNQTFGYQSRYAEYKQLPNRICGDFRTTLDFWHLGRQFSSLPSLNSDFIRMSPSDSSRIWAVNEYVNPETGKAYPLNHLWVLINHRIKSLRQLPYYGTPI